MGIYRRVKGGGGGIFQDIIPPENKNLAWVDTSVVGVPLVKIWNETSQEWKATGSTSTAVGIASGISFDATGTSYTSGNVQGALVEVNTRLNAKAASTALSTHTADTTIHILANERTNWNSKAAGDHTHSELHTHANKMLLDKVAYTGAKTTIDLKSIEDNATAITNHTHSTLYNTKTEITDLLNGYATKDANGKVSGALVADAVAWSGVSDKPTTFAPATHAHPISEVTGLESALLSKANQLSVENMFNTLSTLQSTIASLELRIETLEGNVVTGPPVEWVYDFVIPASVGAVILTDNPGWTHTLTAVDIYGPAYDGVGAKAELRMLGVQDGTLDEPGQVMPRDGIDIFAAPSIHGAYTWDADVSQLLLSSMALNPYYFRIVKYV